MAIVEEIKCSRCDRKYSGVRSRCPYCGARRIGRGKYSESSDNAKGKMLISVLIMGVFVVAAIVLLATTDTGDATEPPSNGLSLPGEDGNVEEGGIALETPPPPTPTPTPTPPPTPPPITSLEVRFGGTPTEDFTMTRIGEELGLRIHVEPPGAEAEYEIIWESSDESVFQVVPVFMTEGGQLGMGATVTAIGNGHETLTVTVGDQSAEVIVRVRAS